MEPKVPPTCEAVVDSLAMTSLQGREPLPLTPPPESFNTHNHACCVSSVASTKWCGQQEWLWMAALLRSRICCLALGCIAKRLQEGGLFGFFVEKLR